MIKQIKTISINILFLMGISGVWVSCSQTSQITRTSPGAQTTQATELNPPRHIKLSVKDFSEALGLKQSDLGRWRLVDSENRTINIATEGDRISWTAGDDQSLQLQFPEKMARRLFRVIEGDKSIFREKFIFNLEKGETLTVEVIHPHPEGTRELFELTYSVLNRTAGELVATDSPPKMILMFR